jgi:predicted  nucleic acid-binding Zn-ribbon protein
MKYRILCTLCGETFVHRGEEMPDDCPECGQYIGMDGKPEVAAPRISLRGAKAPDDLYRSMERGAEHRMNMAAEISGQPVSEFSSMKMTNMKDNVREGDTTFMPPTPIPNMGQTMGQVDPNVAAGLRSGPHARAGASQLKGLQQFHQTNHHRMNAVSAKFDM